MPDRDDEVQAVPAGSLPINDEDNLPSEPVTPPPEEPSSGEGKEDMILGKFKSVDDLIKSYQDLEREHGRLGGEVGTLRKQTELQQKQAELLLNQMASLKQGAGNEPPLKTGSPDFDQQLADLKTKVESGDIDISEALAQTVGLTSAKAEMVAREAVKRAREEERATSVRDQFLKNNPDFFELQSAGVLQSIKDENPMHDDFSAYHEYKLRETLANIEAERKAAYEKGMAEAAKLAQGAEAAGRVSGKTGAAVRAPTGTKPLSEGERIQGMLDILRKVRSGNT